MVVRKENETVDALIRRFKKQTQNAGILADYMSHTEFVGPSEKRRKKSEAARKKLARLQRKYNRD